jgi:hypothetical protein
MQEKRGWFPIEKAAMQLLREGCDPKRGASTIAVYSTLLEIANDARSSTVEATRNGIAALAMVNVDTVDRVVTDLAAIGLVAVERGTRGTPNRWTLLAPGVAASGGQGVPPQAVGGTASSGSTRARPRPLRGLGGELRDVEEKKNKAPDGADSLSTSAENAMGEEALLAFHADVLAGHTGVPARQPSARDMEAAARLAGRLGSGWREPVDAALHFALGDSFWAQKVATVAGLERNIDSLLAGARGKANEAAATAEVDSGRWGGEDDENDPGSAAWVEKWQRIAESAAADPSVEAAPADLPGWAADVFYERREATGLGAPTSRAPR